MEANLQSNFNVGFTNMKSDVLIHLTQWQYWWWFWFSLLWAFYYLMVLKMIRFRSIKFRPRLATTFRPHGKWGDLIVCIIPISWCANIITNSNFILRMIEWQSESGLLTVRIRGKQWYWVYKFELKTFTDIFTVPKNVGHNKWQIATPGDLQVADDYLHILQLRSQNRWVKSYWEELSKEVSKSKNYNLISNQDILYNEIPEYRIYVYEAFVTSLREGFIYSDRDDYRFLTGLMKSDDFEKWPEHSFGKLKTALEDFPISRAHFDQLFVKFSNKLISEMKETPDKNDILRGKYDFVNSYLESPFLDSNSVEFFSKKNIETDSLVSSPFDGFYDTDLSQNQILDISQLKQNNFLTFFLRSLHESTELPEEFYFILNQVLMHIYEGVYEKGRFHILELYRKSREPKARPGFDFSKKNKPEVETEKKITLVENDHENFFIRVRNKKIYWNELSDADVVDKSFYDFLKNDDLFKERISQYNDISGVSNFFFSKRKNLQVTYPEIKEYFVFSYSDFNDFDRFSRKSQGTVSPIRLIKYPLSNKNNLDLSSDVVELFRFRFNEAESETKHRLTPNTSFLTIRQKRYKRRKVILPRTLFKKDIEGNLTKQVKTANYTFLNQNKIIMENDFNATKRYRFFRKNKVRDELTNLVLSKRMLRTRRTLVLPAHVNITAITNSFDVIHSWFIPGLGLKMDAIPGRATHHTFYIDNVGFYYGQCAEICGRYHHHMPIRICALPFEHFLLWWQSFGLPKLLSTKNFRRYGYTYGARKYVW